MAVDLKIEIFSNNLFQHLYELEFLELKERHHNSGAQDKSELTNEILHAVRTRENLYRNYYTEHIGLHYYQYSGSGTDLYKYLQNATPLLCLPLLNIFDNILSLYAFLYTMAKFCHAKENDIYINDLPLCCAMYFDTKLKDEFYNDGGWNELNRQASIYSPITLSHREFSSDIENAVDLLMRVCSNYDLKLVRNYIFIHLNKRINEGKLKMSCLKCELLIGAFVALKNSYDYSSGDIKFIEGILQIMLCMPSPERQVSKFQENFNDSLLTTHENHLLNKFEYYNSGTSQKNLDTEILEMRNNEQSNLISEFLRNLFADFDDEQVKIKLESCSFCNQNICKPTKSSKGKSLNKVKNIKSLIMNKVKLYCSPVNEFENSTVFPEKANDTLSIKSNQTPLSELYEKLTISEAKHPPRNSTFEKDVLRLFIALGIEPVKCLILSDLNTNIESNTECSTSNHIKNENKSIVRRKNKKKSEKKEFIKIS